MFPTPIEKRGPAHRFIYKISLPVALLIWLVPLLGVMMTAVRGPGDITAGNLWGTPSEWMLITNLTDVFTNTPMLHFILNSFKITIPTMLGAVALSCMAALPLPHISLKAIYCCSSPLLREFYSVSDFDDPRSHMTSNWGFMIRSQDLMFHVAFQTGFCTLFMRNFIKALPSELLEAARIDGASEFKIFWKIVLPLTRPAIAALCVLIFTFIWNDYFWATVLIQGQHAMPVTAGLKSLNGQWIAAYHLISAGSIVAAVPPILIFFIMQRHFIAGLTLGATKG